jgi:hypothetical protein
MLFQLGNRRQKLLALMTTKRQLQKFRCPIMDSHLAGLLYHLDYSCKQGRKVYSGKPKRYQKKKT